MDIPLYINCKDSKTYSKLKNYTQNFFLLIYNMRVLKCKFGNIFCHALLSCYVAVYSVVGPGSKQ